VLEVHQGEDPGEPMKPLSELVKELRKKEAFSHINISAKHAAGIGYAAAKVEAWLREADLATRPQDLELGSEYPHGYGDALRIIRRELFGTTRTEGEE